jgi:hypothetical protein
MYDRAAGISREVQAMEQEEMQTAAARRDADYQ